MSTLTVTAAPRLGKLELRIAAADPDSVTRADARQAWAQYRSGVGGCGCPPLLTAPTGNTKLRKSLLPSYGLSLLPARLAGVGNLCASSTRGCRKACLNTAGRGGSPHVINGRLWRTGFLYAHTTEALHLIRHELGKATDKHGTIAFRPNVLADLRWETIAPWLLEIPNVVTYDYTKHYDRQTTDNYRLSYSVHENTTDEQIHQLINAGRNPVIVFHNIPDTYLGHPVHNGDETDERFLDPQGIVIGLRAKGQATNDTTGFVR